MLEVKILGSGCANCQRLAEYVQKAAEELEIELNLEKVTEMSEIISYGVMRTPGLVINGQVKISGRVPKTDEIKDLLKKSQG